jgi:hypothetical protein
MRDLISALEAELEGNGPRCQSIGETETGIRCCPTFCGK